MRRGNENSKPDVQAHFSEIELIELGAGVSGVSDEQSRHAAQCERCAAALSAIQASLAWFDDPEALRRREERIRPRAASAAGRDQPWWRRISDSVSLAPLRPRHTAYADAGDEASAQFPIYDGDRKSACAGVARRHGREYYALASTPDDGSAVYGGRQVEIAIWSVESEEAVVTRTIDLDRPALLGTDLECASQRIAARFSE